ncbi:hypothetical protein [Oceanicoccus sagamiensis]|uniref:Uncharacterized protein n=1 Tax=Oceanicoccus sagamiensis TaxID=716816 RepID=A0A1X9N6U0_9GAMM|nr:hypothetical protein [Oceanicoccus sagamiensis]ARN72874.1 hypothetical protein BST96_01385 [Oceanicoccus sagamiensis]
MKNSSKSITSRIAFTAASHLQDVFADRVRFRADACDDYKAVELAFPGLKIKGSTSYCAVKVGTRSVYLTAIEFFGAGLPKLCIYSEDLNIRYTEYFSQTKLNSAVARVVEIVDQIEGNKAAA